MTTASYHMLAVFNAQFTRPPMGLDLFRPSLEKKHPLDEEERSKLQDATVVETLQSAAKQITVPEDKRKLVQLGNGNGLVCGVGPFCHYAERDGVFAMCSGELAELPAHIDLVSAAHDGVWALHVAAYIRGEAAKPDENDAAWLLELYESFKQFVAEDVAESALSTLCNLRGQFAFVIYDRTMNRVLAARDSFGSQPLYWGTTDDGRFMFGSCVEDLLDCNPSATLFPAGSLFVSEGNSALACSPGEKGWFITCDWQGQLFSFLPGMTHPRSWRHVKAIPRVMEDGTVCGAVFRVASELTLPTQAMLALPPCVM